jgi:NADH-quinone oxidoreductase subunit C
VASSPSRLSPADIGDRLRAQFGQDVLEYQEVHGHPVATVVPSRLHEICEFLRDEPELDFDFIDFVTAVDERPRGGGFTVVVHVFSTRRIQNARLKVRCDAEDPRCPSIHDVWVGANWFERETWELFGVVFEGHPHLVKLVLPEQFEGYPLRKDFPLMTREAKPWPGDVEGEEDEE